MLEVDSLPACERVGDGVGDTELAAHVADALPFMHFAIADTTFPNNSTGRMPSDDPDHWLAVNNCGASSRALIHFLGERGYNASMMTDISGTHGFVKVQLKDKTAYIDPTALQFLSRYELKADNSDFDHKFDNISGTLLPNERVIIFDPEDYTMVGEWLALVVKRYWQTKTLSLCAAGLMSMFPGPIYRRRQAQTMTQDAIAEDLGKLYHPDNLVQIDHEGIIDYAEMYKAWMRGVKPSHIRKMAGL